ncbi:MAG: hypothetical protein VX223_01130 [Myxococcota bacterium]|nr:hypothetical protein [Myxococcota bacterium]
MRNFLMVLATMLLLGCSSDSESRSSGTATDSVDNVDAVDGVQECTNTSYFSGAVCDPTCENSGCADGQVCGLSNGGLVCTAPGTQPIGKGCNESTACADGFCLQDGLGSTCFSACVGDGDCPANYTCSIVVADTSPELRACAEKGAACSVLTQECSPAEDGTVQGCYLAGAGPECAVAGTLEEGAACEDGNACKPGLLCISDRCHVACNPNTSGPNPKCDFTCALGAVGIEGETSIAICDLVDEDPDCNLLQQNCAAGQACYVTGQGAKCKDAGTKSVGSACVGPGDCVPNTVCQAGQCRTLCNPSDALHEECESELAQCSSVGQGAGYCDE